MPPTRRPPTLASRRGRLGAALVVLAAPLAVAYEAGEVIPLYATKARAASRGLLRTARPHARTAQPALRKARKGLSTCQAPLTHPALFLFAYADHGTL